MTDTLTPTGTTPNVLSSDPTQVQWAQQVLTDGGWPVTQNNMIFMLDWMQSENSPSTWTGTAGANNPLNNGYLSGGGSGLGSYPSLTAAAAAAAANLAGGANGYAAVTQLLGEGTADPSALAAAMEQSGWAASHYGYGSAWITSAGEAFAAGNLSLVPSSASAANGATPGVAAASAEDASFLSQAGSILKKVLDPLGLYGDAASAVGGVSGVARVAEDAAKLAEDLLSPSWWKRVGVFVLGAAVFTVGLALFITTSKPEGGKETTTTPEGTDGGDGIEGGEGGEEGTEMMAALSGLLKGLGEDILGAGVIAA